MIKIRNKVSFICGSIILLLTVPSGILSNLMSLSSILMILISIYLILDGILDQKTKILGIVLGFLMLISFIWLVTQKALSSMDLILGIIAVLYTNIIGLMVYFDILPEKWIRA